MYISGWFYTTNVFVMRADDIIISVTSRKSVASRKSVTSRLRHCVIYIILYGCDMCWNWCQCQSRRFICISIDILKSFTPINDLHWINDTSHDITAMCTIWLHSLIISLNFAISLLTNRSQHKLELIRCSSWQSYIRNDAIYLWFWSDSEVRQGVVRHYQTKIRG